MKRKKRTKVLCFGTFDFLHPGHEDFFRQARKLGTHLSVVVARDTTVLQYKRYKPNGEKKRLRNVRSSALVDRAVLGQIRDPYRIIEILQPDVIGLGYDQKIFVPDLQKALRERKLKVRLVRLQPHKPHLYKSSIMRKRLDASALS